MSKVALSCVVLDERAMGAILLTMKSVGAVDIGFDVIEEQKSAKRPLELPSPATNRLEHAGKFLRSMKVGDEFHIRNMRAYMESQGYASTCNDILVALRDNRVVRQSDGRGMYERIA